MRILDEKRMAIAQVEEVQAQLTNLEKEMSSPTKQQLAASDILLQKWMTRKTLQTVEFDETEDPIVPRETAKRGEMENHSQPLVITSEASSIVEHAVQVAHAVEKIPGFSGVSRLLAEKG